MDLLKKLYTYIMLSNNKNIKIKYLINEKHNTNTFNYKILHNTLSVFVCMITYILIWKNGYRYEPN